MFESWKVRPRKIGKLENGKMGKLGPENWKNGKWKVRPRKIGKLEKWKVRPRKLENWENGTIRPRQIGKLESWPPAQESLFIVGIFL